MYLILVFYVFYILDYLGANQRNYYFSTPTFSFWKPLPSILDTFGPSSAFVTRDPLIPRLLFPFIDWPLDGITSNKGNFQTVDKLSVLASVGLFPCLFVCLLSLCICVYERQSMYKPIIFNLENLLLLWHFSIQLIRAF